MSEAQFEMNKKGTIGTILTWIPAMIIIFFIMLIFFSGVAALTTKKNVSLKSNFEIVEGQSLESEIYLDSFLNFPVEKDGKKLSVKDLILENKISNNPLIEKSFDSFLNSFEPKPKCYLFHIEGFFNPIYGGSVYKDIFGYKKWIERSIVDDNGEVQIIKFYLGDEC